MSLRTDLISTVDAARGILDDLGLRLHVVQLRTTTWSGNAPGRGTASHADTEITPPPKVGGPKVGGPPRKRFDEPGASEGGDVVVSKISATYTEEALRGATVWRIDGQDHRLVRLEKRAFEWVATLTRMNRGG